MGKNLVSYVSLGVQLDHYRKERKISVTHIARECGMGKNSVEKVLKGHEGATIGSLNKVMYFLGMSAVSVRNGERIMILRDAYGLELKNVIGGELSVVVKEDEE